MDYSGEWEGTFEMTMTEGSLGITDTCTGEFTLRVTDVGDSPVDGRGTCAWGGAFSVLTGPGELFLDGALDSVSRRIDGSDVTWRSFDADNSATAQGEIARAGSTMGVLLSGSGSVNYIGLNVPVEFNGRLDLQR